MRICLMNDNFNRSGGVTIAIKRIAQALVDVDYFVVACEDDSRPQDLAWIPEGKFAMFYLKTSNLFLLWKEILRFKQWFDSEKLDLVHCHHRRLAAILQVAQVPVLYTGHLVFKYESWFRWLHPRRMTAVTDSVAHNIYETTRRNVLARIGNPVLFPDSCPCVDLARVQKRAICIARLDAVKGHTHLLKAWKLLCDRGKRYELDLVGEGTLFSELSSQVERDGMDDLVHFVGYTSEVSSAIQNSLFAILVSEFEGQGIVTLEAASMGRASLLTAVPGSVDLLPPDGSLVNGLEFGNAVQLADALEQWFAVPEQVVEEGTRFFHFLKTTSDPVRVATGYRSLYQQIVAGVA